MKYFKRRQFLQFLMFIMMAFKIRASDKKLVKNKKKIVIVGAGISGLACAKKLQKENFEVLVLEASKKIGGRINTIKWQDHNIEIGPIFLNDSDSDELEQFVEAVPVKMVSFDDQAFASDNKLIDQEQIDKIFLSHSKDLKAHLAAIDKETNKTSLLGLITTSSFFNKYDKLKSDILKHHIQKVCSWAFGSQANSMDSAYYADLFLEQESSDTRYYPNGLDFLTQSIAKGLDVRTERKVTSIYYKDDITSVFCDNDEYKADAIVVALPLRILKRQDVGFFPVLKKEKLKAITKLQLSSVKRLYVLFNDVFWKDQEDVDWIGNLNTSSEFNYSCWLNLYKQTKKPILSCTFAGESASAIQGLTKESLKTSILKSLKQIFPDKNPIIKDTYLTDWKNENFNSDEVFFVSSSADVKASQDLAKPVANKLFFAGEACACSGQTGIAAAFTSGVATAEEVIKVFHRSE